MFDQLNKRARAAYSFFTADENRWILTWLDRFLTVLLVGLLVYQLLGMPVADILDALPSSPVFYLIWLFLFFLVPVFEYRMYQYKWKYSGLDAFRGFMIKKIYNNELYNYTGELYFINWISSYLNVSKTEAALFIKDHNVISSIVSSLLAFGTIGFLWFAGFFDASKLLEGSNDVMNVIAVSAMVLVIIVIFRFRKSLIHSDRALAWRLFRGYSIRFIFRHIVLVAMWYSAAPEVPVTVWLNFLFVKLLLDRFPVGNRNLIFLTMAPWLSDSFSIGIETFTGIQLTVALLDKLMSSASLFWAKRSAPINESPPAG